MRDNVSIIFAAIFAVLLLIVFPLFSLLTRQDNIAYNKVLTITTEFVDSVRTKGYFTEKEYTDYLVKLAATQNTYKVDMECHEKLLIKDVENYTDANPIWVEDTAVYYNSYIENELKSSGSVALEEGDEFYIKVYNTNITTASLMYNFFLGSSIPRKVINIGYGGKILNSTGDTFTKTTFNSSYTPYVTFGEVVNNNGENFKYCYDQQAGTYDMQYCIRIIDIEDENNNPIKVNFKLHNFAKIGDRDLNSVTFDENMSYFIDTIKENVVLRGNYVDTYDVTIDNLKYVAGRVEGTISIGNISMNSGAWQTKAYIVITPDLGVGPTGAVSTEGTTEELTLRRRNISVNVVVDGPYLSKTDTEVVTDTLSNKETVYYKVTLKDSYGIKKLELYDTLNSKVVAEYDSVKLGDEFSEGEYNVKIEEVSELNNTMEYWISVTPTYSNEGQIYSSQNFELQLVVYANIYTDVNVTSEFKKISNVATWKNVIMDFTCTEIEYDEDNDYIKVTFNRTMTTADRDELLVILNNNKIIYITREDTGEELEIEFSTIIGDGFYSYGSSKIAIIKKYNHIPKGAPEKTSVKFNFRNSAGDVKSSDVVDNYYINIPKGFEGYLRDGVVKIGSGNWSPKYTWIPAEESDIEDWNAYYDDDVTSAMIRSSIRKYGGFYVTEITDQYCSTFDGAWEVGKEKHTQLFGSVIYKWQLKKIYDVYGENSPIEESQQHFWVAEKNNYGNGVKARWTENGYYEEDGKINEQLKQVRVLYIK